MLFLRQARWRIPEAWIQTMSWVLLLAMLFPYTQLIPLGSYTQPYSYGIGLVLFIVAGFRQLGKMPGVDAMSLLLLAFAGALFLMAANFPIPHFQEVKYLLMYGAPLILVCGSLDALERSERTTIAVIEWATAIWLIVGLMQTFYDTNFATFLVGEWQISAEIVLASGRGVLSLAPEPTHHGFHLLLLAATLVVLKGNRILAFAAFAASLLLAKSASVVMALGIGALLLMMSRPAIFLFFCLAAALLLPIVAFAVNGAPEQGTRLVYLISLIFTDPKSLFELDRSVNTRLGGIVAAAKVIWDVGLLPQGLSYGNWLSAQQHFLSQNPWLGSISDAGWPSGYLILIYQLGPVGVVFIGLLAHRIYSVRLGLLEKTLVLGAFSVFFLQFYISSPTFSLLYAAILWRMAKDSRLDQSSIAPSQAYQRTPYTQLKSTESKQP